MCSLAVYQVQTTVQPPLQQPPVQQPPLLQHGAAHPPQHGGLLHRGRRQCLHLLRGDTDRQGRGRGRQELWRSREGVRECIRGSSLPPALLLLCSCPPAVPLLQVCRADLENVHNIDGMESRGSVSPKSYTSHSSLEDKTPSSIRSGSQAGEVGDIVTGI